MLVGRRLTAASAAARRVRARRAATAARSSSASSSLRVVVTGAGGRTGSLVLKRLLADADTFAAPKGVLRPGGKVPDGVTENSVLRADVAAPDAAAALAKAFAGADAVVVLTSAAPKPKPLSILVALVSKVVPWMEARRPEFVYPEGAEPERVDFEAQVKQIDAAKAAGVKRVVLCSSMGGTQVDNFLNTMGGGNILLWKRKAEKHLVASGMEYAIVHPGGLLDKPAGERQLLVGVDDTLLDGDNRSVPRDDVAAVIVHCLTSPSASKISFDLASMPPGEGTVSADLEALLGELDGKTYDYSLPANSPVPL